MVKLLHQILQAKFPDCVYQIIETEEKKNYYSWNHKRFSKKTGIIKIRGEGHICKSISGKAEYVGLIERENDKYYYVPMIGHNVLFTKSEPIDIIICPFTKEDEMAAWREEKFAE